jgi:integron integrase
MNSTPSDLRVTEPLQISTQPPRLLALLSARLRTKHYSIRTERAYCDWVRRFVLFHDKRHPKGMGSAEIEAFLSHLALARRVAASTQNQAKSALLFLYKEVLGIELPWLDNITRAKAPQRLPVVLTLDETRRLLQQLEGTRWLMASLLYGCGLRLLECLRLRIKDVDFEQRELLVRDGKGAKDRVTMLPVTVIEPLRAHLRRVKAVHEQDLADGYGEVYLPDALARKYPSAGKSWAWQYVFSVCRSFGGSTDGCDAATSS